MKLQLFLILLSSATSPLCAQADQFFGAPNASTALPAGKDYIFVANDEDEKIQLYQRTGGKPLSSFDFSKELRDPRQMNEEVDIEASTRIGNRIYWLGSHSNKKSNGKLLPSRHRLFATDLSNETNLTFVGRYDLLRKDLVDWDKQNFHLGLEQAAAIGVSPEQPDGKGFNIEGLSVAPDGKTALIGFRVPLIMTNGSAHALIIPLLNMPDLVNSPRVPAKFGPPVLLDLGGRGIRSMETFGQVVLIVAGPAVHEGDFKLFVWDGNPKSRPVRCETVLEKVGGEHKLRPEAIVGMINSGKPGEPLVQLLSDDGKNGLDFVGFRSFNVPVCPVAKKR